MTPRGVSHVYKFVERGGTLVTLDSTSELPIINFDLPIPDVTARHADTDFCVPGTLVALEVDPTHPVDYGIPPQTAAFIARSPIFEVPDTSRGHDAIIVVARSPRSDLLRSGWLLGEEVLADRAAVVEEKVGRGRVVLVGFRAKHRGQPHGTFKLLFNPSILDRLRPRPRAPAVNGPRLRIVFQVKASNRPACWMLGRDGETEH